MKNSRNRIILSAAFLVVAWNIAAWFIAENYYQSRIEGVISQESRLAQDRASDLADSIHRNLHYLHGIPELFSQSLRFRKAVSRFGTSSIPSPLPLATKIKRWSNDPELKGLGQFVLQASNSLHADLIYVLNAAGDCIAASNAGTPGSPVGNNYADRDYFKKNRDGQPGMQYAMGRTTHIAGIYFTSPIIIDGHFMGVIAVKIDVPSLSFLINTLNAFVADENGVIILARDKWLEMSVLSGATVSALPDIKKNSIYGRSSFPVLPILSWSDSHFSSLARIPGKKTPHIMVSMAVPEYGMKVYAMSEVPEFLSLQQDCYWFALLLGIAGTVLIFIGNGMVLYLNTVKRSQVLLREQKNQLETFMQAAHEGIHILDADGRAILVNAAFCDMLGYAHEEMLGMQVPQWDAKATHGGVKEWFAKIVTEGGSVFETRWQRKDGHELDVEISVVVVETDGEKTMYCSARDITERKRIEEELFLATLVLENSSDGMVVTNERNHIIAVNPAFFSITGYTLEEVKGKNPRIFSSGKHDLAFFQAMWHELTVNGHWQGEIWDRRKNGDVHAKWLTINTALNADGSVHRYVALFSDITEKKRSEELIWKQANFDTLTGLPNRHMFLDHLQLEVKKSHRAGLALALLLIDLDEFKEVNDTLGHAMGDILLQQTAQRISVSVREADTVARLGGDEFTVILSELADNSHAEAIAQKIIGSLAQPFYLGNEVVYVSASVGITLYPNDADDIDDLMKNADQAMYEAKRQGRNRFSYYTQLLQESAQNRLRLTNDLRGAMGRQQLRVLFQPIVELSSGRIHKAEALLRWQHPERGMISPVDFIPLAEASGLIHGIGDWVFKESARWAKRWSTQFATDFKVSVNKSPVQFRAEGSSYTAAWVAYLQELGLPGKHMIVEITEGLLLHADAQVFDKLLVFRDAGIQVAIDDFGTGYSSLSYLKKFDIDYLKIDQSFVRNLSTDKGDVALCEAIIVMAHKLGLQVIAEGVETEQQRVVLAAAGCDYAQGYLFSRPVPPEEFESLLKRT